jgi:hypothetical protein
MLCPFVFVAGFRGCLHVANPRPPIDLHITSTTMPRLSAAEISAHAGNARLRQRGLWLALIAALGLIFTIAGLATPIGKVSTQLNGRPMHASLTLWKYCMDYTECTHDPRTGEERCTDHHRCEDPGKFTCEGESAHYQAGRAFYILALLAFLPLLVVGILDCRRGLPDFVCAVPLRKFLAAAAFTPAVFAFIAFVITMSAWHRDHCQPSINDQPGASIGASPFMMLLACVFSVCGFIIALVYRTRVEVAELVRVHQLKSMPQSHSAPVVVTSHPHRGTSTFDTEHHATEPLNNDVHDAINVEIARSLYTEDEEQPVPPPSDSGIRVGRPTSRTFEI